VVAVLPRFQVQAGRDLDYSVCYPCPQLRPAIDHLGPELLQVLLFAAGWNSVQRIGPGGADFGRLTHFLLTANCNYFLYRDFQSRNIMLRNGDPFFVDYQGGRKGALQYDIASLLYDAKADLPPELTPGTTRSLS